MTADDTPPQLTADDRAYLTGPDAPMVVLDPDYVINPVVAALLGPPSRRTLRTDVPMTDDERELDAEMMALQAHLMIPFDED